MDRALQYSHERQTADGQWREDPIYAELQPGRAYYTCRKCRRRLFFEASVAAHEPGRGEEEFAWRRRDEAAGVAPECHSLFIEPMAWMKELGQVKGKLHCPKCATRIGNFDWSGSQCSCGRWVVPALAVPRSKVDRGVLR